VLRDHAGRLGDLHLSVFGGAFSGEYHRRHGEGQELVERVQLEVGEVGIGVVHSR
jgi:hypothetical protein